MLSVLLLPIFSGCKVTSDDIEFWKGTVKGPGKIVAVMLAERYPMELRTQAAMALVEMERQDRDGVAMLQEAIQRIQHSNPESVQQIIDGMVPQLEAQMRGSDNANQEEGAPPSTIQVRAKDAAYLLVTHASDESQTQLINAVVDWFTVDFANRSLSGNYSAEQVVRSLGAAGASRLVTALNIALPKAALVNLCDLIKDLGSDETKAAAATRLLAIEQEANTQEYVNGLRDAYKEQNPDVSDEQALGTAIFNRDRYIVGGVLPAMKHLASQDPIRNRLLAIANTAAPAGSPEAVVNIINERRRSALQALEGNATEAQLEAVLAIALNNENPADVRDYAFDRVGDIRSRAAIPALWPLVQYGENDTNQKRLRWRAGELVLAIGGAEIVGEFLSKLPTGDGVQYEPEELAGYATRMSQMTPQPVDIVERQLSASTWFARVIALRFIERRGSEADAAKLERLAQDATAVVGQGWAGRELDTVGKVAQQAVAALRERLAEPEEGSAEASSMSASAME